MLFKNQLLKYQNYLRYLKLLYFNDKIKTKLKLFYNLN